MTSTHITSHPIPTNNTSPCVSHSLFLSSWSDSAGLKSKRLKITLPERFGTFSRSTNMHAHCQGCVRLAYRSGCFFTGETNSESNQYLIVYLLYD